MGWLLQGPVLPQGPLRLAEHLSWFRQLSQRRPEARWISNCTPQCFLLNSHREGEKHRLSEEVTCPMTREEQMKLAIRILDPVVSYRSPRLEDIKALQAIVPEHLRHWAADDLAVQLVKSLTTSDAKSKSN